MPHRRPAPPPGTGSLRLGARFWRVAPNAKRAEALNAELPSGGVAPSPGPYDRADAVVGEQLKF